MDNLLTVVLEAHHAAENHHRRYEVAIGRDLFNAWTVAIRYGRVGQGGQEDRFGGTDAEELKAVIRDRLRRRLSAPRRIGVLYRLAEIHASPGFDASAWLPGELMVGFAQPVPSS